MDIGQFIFPFIMAVITNSIMIVAIYFLRKIPYFANLFSVWFMVILYLVCILRMFLPLEFPDVQIVMMDSTFYTSIVNAFTGPDEKGVIVAQTPLYIALAVWTIGIIVFAAVSVVKQRSFIGRVKPNSYAADPDEQALFSRISKEILNTDKRVSLKKSDVISGAMVIGLINKTVYISDRTYREDELGMIFRHECTHIRNKDLWIKLLIQIYCCVFWWNPFAYLLKHDLNLSLEIKCDLSVVKGFPDTEVLSYISALTDNAQDKSGSRHPFTVCAELSNASKGRDLVKRMKAITSDPPNRPRQIAANIAVMLLILAVFVSSYLFIWQPFYGFDAPNDNYEMIDEKGYISDDSNSYLVRQPDGSYLFYFSDYPPMEVSQEEFEEGMFEGYPIYE